MIIPLRVDAYELKIISDLLRSVKFFERAEVIKRMTETNQLMRFTSKEYDELNLPTDAPESYVPVARVPIILTLPKRTWNIGELRAFVRTGDYTFRGRDLHADHPLIGISRTGANLAVREIQGFMIRTGPGQYSFTLPRMYHSLTGIITPPKVTWDKFELATWLAGEVSRPLDVAQMIVDQLEPRLSRTGRGEYTFTTYDVQTGYGTQSDIYPIKASLGIFVSMSGKPKYDIENKLEVFNHVPAEWDAGREYDFMYKLLDYCVVVWSDDKYDLGALLGKTDPTHRWHLPGIGEINDAVNKFDVAEFEGNFSYRQLANADDKYINFFSTNYSKKIDDDSLFRYFQRDGLKQTLKLVRAEPKIYKELLEEYGIERYYDGKNMAVMK
jgi:hypothetical protein